MLIGSNILELTVKGERGIIVSEFGTIPHIQDIKFVDSEEEGCIDITITAKRDVDLREIIFYKLAKMNCPIYRMQSSTMSLEEVFLELTENEGKAVRTMQNLSLIHICTMRSNVQFIILVHYIIS